MLLMIGNNLCALIVPQHQKNLFFLIGSCFHLGKYRGFRHNSITVYLLGVRNNLDYFNGIAMVVHLKVALRFFWEGFCIKALPKVLFFRQHDFLRKFAGKIIAKSIAFIRSRWPAGIMGNWHTKVSVPLVNYHLTISYQLTTAEHNRYFKLLKGFNCLLGKPDLVVFLEFPGLIALKDCWLNGVPSISVTDSNSNCRYATYVIPGYCSGFAQCIILSLFLELLVFVKLFLL